MVVGLTGQNMKNAIDPVAGGDKHVIVNVTALLQNLMAHLVPVIELNGNRVPIIRAVVSNFLCSNVK